MAHMDPSTSNRIFIGQDICRKGAAQMSVLPLLLHRIDQARIRDLI
jgi:hypothetical protein